MGFTKGSNQKFTKKRTSVSTPSIVKPTIEFQSLNWNGAADMDENNPEKTYFHVFGAAPTEAKLYLYGDRFNQAFYTEIGEHDHGPGTLQTGNVNVGDTTHNHTTDTYHRHYNNFTSGTDYHSHRLYAEVPNAGTVDTSSDPAGYTYGSPALIEGESSHAHPIQGYTDYQGSGSAASTSISLNAHQHAVASGDTDIAGISPAVGSVRVSGSPKQYFDDLRIEIDGVDKTADLKLQAGVAKFGDGTSGHSIVTSGIELDIQSYIVTPGEHKIIFSLPGSNNGGKLRWYIYIF